MEDGCVQQAGGEEKGDGGRCGVSVHVGVVVNEWWDSNGSFQSVSE